VTLLLDCRIKDVLARVCYDSRGVQTIEVELRIDGAVGRVAAPAGASVGKHEAIGLVDNDAKKTCRVLETYRKRIIGADASDLYAFAQLLHEIDGTSNFSRIGGSAAYAISVAAAEAASKKKNIPLYAFLARNKEIFLPFPLGNVLGGGKHAGEGSPDIQEFLACPKGAKNIADALMANVEVHSEVRKIIERKDSKFSGGKGDEGAWAYAVNNERALEITYEAVSKVSDKLGFEVRMGLDIASSSMWNPKSKVYNYSRAGEKRTPEEQENYVLDLVEKYDLVYIEDPVHEEDFDGFKRITSSAKHCIVTGDDLFVTNPERIKKAAKIGAGNGAILKVNQVGTLGDALEFAKIAKSYKYAVTTSHRSGDSPDYHLAHIAVGTDSLMMKSGVVGGERVAKLNELLRINDSTLINKGKHVPMAKFVV
jgi:enolase